MRYFLKRWLFSVFALWLVSQLFPAFILHDGWQGLFFSGCILALLMLIVRPLLSILFIPINFLTFGLASWVINVIVVYLLTVFAPAVSVTPWTFPGLTFQGFIIPSATLNYWTCLVLTTIAITLITNILEDVTH